MRELKRSIARARMLDAGMPTKKMREAGIKSLNKKYGYAQKSFFALSWRRVIGEEKVKKPITHINKKPIKHTFNLFRTKRVPA